MKRFRTVLAIAALLTCWLQPAGAQTFVPIELELLTPRPTVGDVALVRITGSLPAEGPIAITKTGPTSFLSYYVLGCGIITCPGQDADHIVTIGPFEEAGEHVFSYVATPFIDPTIDLVFDVAASGEDPNAPWRVEPLTIDGDAEANDRDPVRLLFTRDTPCEAARLLDIAPIESATGGALVADVLTWPIPCAEPDDLDSPRPATVIEADFGVIPSFEGDRELPVVLRWFTAVELAEARASGAEPEPMVLPLGDVVIRDAADEARLLDDRFGVTVAWQDYEGETGTGRLVTGASDRSALFTFFGVENWEVTVKLLDGCAINGHTWVFLSAATDVAYTVEVTEAATGAVRQYSNPLGTASPAVTDTMAFPCS